MGNRMEEAGVCTACGGPVIEMNPIWGMCVKCLDDIHHQAKEKVKYKDARKDTAKRVRVFIPSMVRPE